MRPTTFDWRDPCATRSPVPSAGGDSTGPTLSEADGLGDPTTGDSPGPSFLTPGVIVSFPPPSIRFGSYFGLSGSSDGYAARFQ